VVFTAQRIKSIKASFWGKGDSGTKKKIRESILLNKNRGPAIAETK